jgi:hypothetical protein
MRWFASVWQEEIPTRIHQRAFDDGGAPQWHPDFALWMSRGEVPDRVWREQPETRVRATRAFRKLRYQAPREYEVLYRTAILNIPLHETIDWLNNRAISNGHPERYGEADVLLYLVVATDKVVSWV